MERFGGLCVSSLKMFTPFSPQKETKSTASSKMTRGKFWHCGTDCHIAGACFGTFVGWFCRLSYSGDPCWSPDRSERLNLSWGAEWECIVAGAHFHPSSIGITVKVLDAGLKEPYVLLGNQVNPVPDASAREDNISCVWLCLVSKGNLFVSKGSARNISSIEQSLTSQSMMSIFQWIVQSSSSQSSSNRVINSASQLSSNRVVNRAPSASQLSRQDSRSWVNLLEVTSNLKVVTPMIFL